MTALRRLAGTFLLLLLCSTTPPATAQVQPYQQSGQQQYPAQEFFPQSQFTSEPNCGQCPPGYHPAYGAGGGSVNIFKATIILEDCPPCPPSYVSANGVSKPQAFPQQNKNSYNYAQQPPLSPSNYYSNNQQQSNNGQFSNPYNYGSPPTNYQQQSGYAGAQNNNYLSGTLSAGYPPQTLSLPYETSSLLQQGGFGSNGGSQPRQQQGFGGQSYSNQALSSSSSNYGGFQPHNGITYGQGEQEGGQIGYLPNYHGDSYSNPQRTQETRALNEPFYQSIGGEPHYYGGDGNTGAGSSYAAVARPFSVEKAKEVTKERVKQRRRLRRK